MFDLDSFYTENGTIDCNKILHLIELYENDHSVICQLINDDLDYADAFNACVDAEEISVFCEGFLI